MATRIPDALLARVLPLVRCPRCNGSLAQAPGGLYCNCGRYVPFRAGYFDFVDAAGHDASSGERFFAGAFRARRYASTREGRMMRLTTGRTFAQEVATITAGLALTGAERVLDLPCGQGNFTEAVARRVPRGLVVAVDLSAAMLELAAARLARARLENVVLLRASALDLPLADHTFDATSACGGLHLYPDVPRALAEARRVLADGGRISGLTVRAAGRPLLARLERALFRLTGAQAFDFDALGDAFRAAGFTGWRWERGPLIGWFSARAAG
jgi:SAM-dependent methyltransferase